MKTLKICFIFLLLEISLIAQDCSEKQGNIWVFGNQALVDFNSNPPTVSSNSSINTFEGCSIFNDIDGNLLFYTDGQKVYDRNHNQMPNGSGLLGNGSATQSGVIVPIPGDDQSFYIFTVGNNVFDHGLRYSIVDLSLNNGLGDINDSKNVLIEEKTIERIAAVQHCNNRDFWLTAHNWETNTLNVYRITETGLDTAPAGSYDIGVGENKAFGQLKFSSDGSKLAMASGNKNRFEVFDFDTESGSISNQVILFDENFFGPYGVEFSPNNRFLYGTNLDSIARVMQFDLSSGNSVDILDSKVILSQIPDRYHFGALQLAPDGKIYIARNAEFFNHFLSAIRFPDLAGTDAGFEEEAIILADGSSCKLGLPNFISSYFYTNTLEVSGPTLVCDRSETLTYKALFEPNCSIDSSKWKIAGGAVSMTSEEDSITIQFLESGNFEITFEQFHSCGIDSNTINVLVEEPLNVETEIQPSCEGNSNGSIILLATGGQEPYEYIWDIPLANDPMAESLPAGSYPVTISDANSCRVFEVIQIPEAPAIEIEKVINHIDCFGEATGAIEILASGCAPLSYVWDDGRTSSTIDDLLPGSYFVTITDCYGCEAVEEIGINQEAEIIIESTVSIPTCFGDVDGQITIDSILGGVPPFEISKDGSYFDSLRTFPFIIQNLSADLYEYLIRDANGCLVSREIEVLAPIDLELTLSDNQIIELGDSIQILIDTNFDWDSLVVKGDDGFECFNCVDFFITPTNTVNLIVTGYDIFGCSTTSEILVTVEKSRRLFMPSAFSPNEDGINDKYWVFAGADVQEVSSLQIFDRWGGLAYRIDDLDLNNSQTDGWDGTISNKMASVGVYVAVANVKFIDGKELVFSQEVTLLR